MTQTISLSPLEFSLLYNELHPEFDSTGSDYEHTVNGKKEFTREIIRLSDNAVFKFVVAVLFFKDDCGNDLNHGDDFICGGDFYIDQNKQDIYDKKGNTVSKPKTHKNLKPEFQYKTNGQIHELMLASGEIEDFNSSKWFGNLSEQSFLDVVNLCKAYLNIEQDHYLPSFDVDIADCGNLIFNVAINEKVNADRLLAETLKNVEMLKQSQLQIVKHFNKLKAAS